MKRFAIIVVLLGIITLGCKARVEPINVELAAVKYVDRFIKEAEFFGIKSKVLNKRLDNIVFYPLRGDIYGLYSPINKQIVINSAIKGDTILLKKTIYHELGHVFKLQHDSGGVMETNLTANQIRLIYSSNIIWDVHVSYLFYKIKRQQRIEKKGLDKSK